MNRIHFALNSLWNMQPVAVLVMVVSLLIFLYYNVLQLFIVTNTTIIFSVIDGLDKLFRAWNTFIYKI